jgi:pimeloyl-ACP methyl ester carboxylesterase
MTEVVLVHGAWGGGWTWDAVRGPLEADGHRVRVVDQLPSGGPNADPQADLAADAAVVRELLDSSDGDAVLVGHSYGGAVIGEVADHAAIGRSVYVCGAWPEAGQPAVDLGEGLPPFVVARPDGLLAMVDDPEVPRAAFAPDLSPEVFATIAPRFGLQSVASVTSVATAPPRSHPTRYLVTVKDPLFPPELQRSWATRATTSTDLPSAHMPMTSCPGLLAKEITAS